jgi:cytochrome c556
MREWRRLSLAAITLAIVVTGTARAAEPADGKAAFTLREETMKRMGRAFYGTIGRVVRGKAELGPDAVAAAETIAVTAGTLGGVFAPGSDVPESRIMAQIFTVQPHVDELVRDVQQAAGRLLPVVKSGDKAALASAYAAVDTACEACHREFRKPVE